MHQDSYEGIDEMTEGIADDLSYRTKDTNIRRMKLSLDSKRRRRIRILWGAGILILGVVAVIFFGGRNNRFAEDLDAVNARIDRLEKQLAQLDLEDTNKKTARLEGQVRALKKSVASLNRSIAEKPKTEPAIKKKPSPKAERRSHKVRPGETLYGIAQKYAISVEKLRRYNNLTKKQAISPGQNLWVAPASKK